MGEKVKKILRREKRKRILRKEKRKKILRKEKRRKIGLRKWMRKKIGPRKQKRKRILRREKIKKNLRKEKRKRIPRKEKAKKILGKDVETKKTLIMIKKMFPKMVEIEKTLRNLLNPAVKMRNSLSVNSNMKENERKEVKDILFLNLITQNSAEKTRKRRMVKIKEAKDMENVVKVADEVKETAKEKI